MFWQYKYFLQDKNSYFGSSIYRLSDSYKQKEEPNDDKSTTTASMTARENGGNPGTTLEDLNEAVNHNILGGSKEHDKDGASGPHIFRQLDSYEESGELKERVEAKSVKLQSE